MRTRVCLLTGFILSFVLFPALAFGQFQQPTQEELKMTSDPKAPGAAAEYLYREEKVDDNLHFHSFYTRIKIFTEKGKDLATVGVPYPKGKFSVSDVKARTIHADGTVVPLDVKPSDLVEQKGSGYQINKMVFTLPSVEPGSILEYRWELRYDDQVLSTPDWDVQTRYYVRKAHYSFVPFRMMNRVVNARGESSNKLLYTSLLPKESKIIRDAAGNYELDVADIPATPDEEYMPPIESVEYQVHFYYSPYLSKDEFWKDEGNRWSKEMDHFANETKTLRDAVNEFVSPSDTEIVKAEKIYDRVMKIENTDFTRRKSAAELKQLGVKQAKQAEDVWNQKSGTSDEIALLYLAMVRSAGLKAYALELCRRNREIFNPFFLSMGQLDDVLVIINTDGKDKVVDPGQRFAAFGDLRWTHQQAGGLRQDPGGVKFVQTSGNSYKEASTVRIADLNIAADGKVDGMVRIMMKGPAALHWRQAALSKGEDEIKKEFDEQMKTMVPDGVQAEFDHFLGLEDPKSTLMGVLKISGNLGTATGKRVFLPGVFFESHVKHPFVAEEQRQISVDMHYAETVRDEVTYHVPDTFAVESAPPDTSIPYTGHAMMALKSVVDKNNIVIARTFILGSALMDPRDYSDLRNFYQKVATADQQQLVLKVAAVNKGE
ncbi:DUF3857 domain-containing protein [Acidicapsa ligni]|uniref:DUF3857 domain-containing protein n=1 Tax=Acidicapsa ligni TaxID=542300 RepID=UPI0021E0B977|nr:DUF3857 domain-containing protein [Acidicapsa ligni]